MIKARLSIAVCSLFLSASICGNQKVFGQTTSTVINHSAGFVIEVSNKKVLKIDTKKYQPTINSHSFAFNFTGSKINETNVFEPIYTVFTKKITFQDRKNYSKYKKDVWFEIFSAIESIAVIQIVVNKGSYWVNCRASFELPPKVFKMLGKQFNSAENYQDTPLAKYYDDEISQLVSIIENDF